jgi:ectoine hydroxylase-related dioxygenase (phytanoyl-CoA dioxygenase family)
MNTLMYIRKIFICGKMICILGGYDYQSFNLNKGILDILLCDPIVSILNQIKFQPTALHAAFVPWKQIDIGWHYDSARELDDYSSIDANPVSDSIHTGVWVALDDVLLEHGPFTFIPKSHKWAYANERKKHSDKSVFEFFDFFRNSKNNCKQEFFLANKGDILVWDGRLLHSVKSPQENFERKAIIGHYSAIKKNATEYNNGYYHKQWPSLDSNNNYPYDR